MPDNSNDSGSDYEVEYPRCPSCINTHRKITERKSIWEFYGIGPKGGNCEYKAWFCVLHRKGFKGRNGAKA